MSAFYIEDEKRVVHQDGWRYVIRDGDEGTVELGYQEIREMDGKSGWVDVNEPMVIALDSLPYVIQAMKHFVERDQ